MPITPPLWTFLNEPNGPHWRTLKRDYVPDGLLELIPFSPGNVLDVGCFCGAVGALLKSKYPNVRVVGVEPVEAAAEIARTKLDAVLTGKLEEVDLAKAGMAPGTVNVIILADVLEHMYNPWQALLSLRPWLAPGGVVLASIPNICNFNVINDLVQGDFPYAGAGILDITHIRFFTWRGVQRLFGETGYRIEFAHFNIDPRCQSLVEGFNQPLPINIDNSAMQLKNMEPDRIRELATLQFWVRAVAA